MIAFPERQHPLQLLNRLTVQVSETRELDSALQAVAVALVHEVGAVMVHLFLYTADAGCPRCRPNVATDSASPTVRLHCLARAGTPLESDGLHVWPDGFEMIDQVVRSRRPLKLEQNAHVYVRDQFIKNARRFPELFGAPDALANYLANPIQTVAFFPLLVRDTLLGVLCSSFARPVGHDEFTCLALVAAQASAAIERAQLYDRLQALHTVRPATAHARPATHRARGAGADEPIGESAVFRSLLDTMRQAAPTDATVLLIGETGTGKELVARALHGMSPRQSRPLVKVNCGAIAPSLLESELFGHERGAFTGAFQRRVGRFELADHGTLFLDELSELPLDGQVKLLRVLQEHEFERVGSSASVHVDVRLICATNRDLANEVATGRFRQDLFYRVSVLPLRVPPLRERREDIALLVRHFLAHFHQTFGTPAHDTSPEALRRLEEYDWPGNVRELRNVIERACVLTTRSTIEVEDLRLEYPPANHVGNGNGSNGNGSNGSNGNGAHESFTTLEEHERRYLRRVLAKTRGRIEGANGAAAILDVHPSTLRSRLNRLGIGRIDQLG
jgi:formate hydrogenlyase transcriptional activator